MKWRKQTLGISQSLTLPYIQLKMQKLFKLWNILHLSSANKCQKSQNVNSITSVFTSFVTSFLWNNLCPVEISDILAWKYVSMYLFTYFSEIFLMKFISLFFVYYICSMYTTWKLLVCSIFRAKKGLQTCEKLLMSSHKPKRF